MVATIKTFSFIGIEVVEVDVQVKITSGFSGFSIVGLPDKSVGESKERVIAALSSTGLSLPIKKLPSILLLLIYKKRELILIYRLPLAYLSN